MRREPESRLDSEGPGGGVIRDSRAGETAQWLTAHDAFSKEQRLVPSTHIGY